MWVIRWGEYTLDLLCRDAEDQVLDLTGVTEVRMQATGPIGQLPGQPTQTLGPVSCTVLDEAGGKIRFPFGAGDLDIRGDWDTEIEARWGQSRITQQGRLTIARPQIEARRVVQGDTPTIPIRVPGQDLTAATLSFEWGSAPEGPMSGISGSVAVGAETDIAEITLDATDTATLARYYGRLVVDGVRTAPLYLIVQQEALT